MKDKCLAIIPARGGSKGIPFKNIRKINDALLIGYSINAALKSKNVSRVVVSTDNSKISEVASSYGAEVIKRPSRLAQDDSSMIDVITHCLDILRFDEDYDPETIILLQPTSPMRTYRHIDAAFKLLKRSPCDAVISVCEPDHHPLKFLKSDRKGFLSSLIKGDPCFSSRQALPRAFAPNGAIFLIKTAAFEKSKTLLPEKTLPYVMSKTDSVDIDDMDDLKYASYLLGKKR